MKKITGNFIKISLLAMLAFFASLDAQAGVVNYTALDSGLIRVTAPTNLVIRNKIDWQNFYIAATSQYFPQPTVPSIDFTKVTVVVVASGERTSGGYQTLISRVFDNPATTTAASYISVQSILINPGSGCMTSMSFTYPAAIFTVPKTAKAFVFSDTTPNAYKTCI